MTTTLTHPEDPSGIYREVFQLPPRPTPIPPGIPMDRRVDGRRIHRLRKG